MISAPVISDLSPGIFIKVHLLSEDKRLKKDYICICQSSVTEGDVKVTFLKQYGESKTKIVLDGLKDWDLSVSQIKQILLCPDIENHGSSRLVYKFRKVDLM